MDKKTCCGCEVVKRQLTEKLQKRLHSYQAWMYSHLGTTSIPNVYWYQFDV